MHQTLKLTASQIIKKLFTLFFLVLSSVIYSQNIQTELFLNENQIEESFKLNSRIEKLFTQNSKDSILVVTD